MPKITNNTREVMDFIVKGNAKDGVPPTESIKPGESRDIDAVDNATYQGRVLAGAITVASATRAAAAPKE